MVLRKPTPSDRLAYFTRRTLGGQQGKVTVWRFDGEELANIEYTCPYCGNSGEKQQVFSRERKRIINEQTGKKKSAEVFTFSCDKCSKPIDIPKWVKKGPGRRKKLDEADIANNKIPPL